MEESLKNHMVNLYLIALSDGHFAIEELDEIVKIGEEKGFTKEEFEKIVSQPNIQFHLPNDFVKRIELLYDFVKVILADGKIDEGEQHIFMRFCEKFEFGQEQGLALFDWLVEMVKNGVVTGDLYSEIKKQIR